MKGKRIITVLGLMVFLCAGCGKTSSGNERKDDLRDEVNRKEEEVREQLALSDDSSAVSETSEEESPADFKEIPCVRIEYYIPPGTSREIEFSQFSLADESFSNWEITENSAEPKGVNVRLSNVSSESVRIELWTLEQDATQPVVGGVASQAGGIWFVRRDDSSYLISFPGMSWMDYLDLSEEEVKGKLIANRILETAFDTGAASLSATWETGYVNTFHLDFNAPDSPWESGLSSAEIRIERRHEEAGDPRSNALGAKPYYKVLVQRYQANGNFVVSGPHLDVSCLE